MESSAYYFHMKKKILADFQICITVPLKVSRWRLLSGPHFFVAYRCSVKKVFLKISQNSQESTCVRASFFIIIIIIINLFKVDNIAKILHAQEIYIKHSNTRIWYAN